MLMYYNTICRRRREVVANVAVLPDAHPIKDSNYGSSTICRRRREIVANFAVLPETYPIKDSNYES